MALKEALRGLVRRGRTAIQYGRTNGVLALVSLTRQKLSDYRSGGLIGKKRVIEFYDFVRSQPVGVSVQRCEVESNTINWVVPPFGFGSGGHLNIFRFVQFLEADGFNCRIIVVGEPRPLSASQARKQIADWFFELKAEVYLGIEAAPPAHITVATGWTTAYFVRRFMPTIHRCYFVQDFEPYFYAAGSEYAWAEETYRFGFYGITAGSWLEKKLATEYGMRTRSFSFSYDRHLYAPQGRRKYAGQRVFFYARPPTHRRAFELGLVVLGEVVRRVANVEIVFAGWDVSEYSIPFKHRNAGTLSLRDLSALYCQCDVALVLSFTNLSLLPLELMACGTPVVSNRAPCTEWLLTKANSCLASPTVEGLADAIVSVLGNPSEAERLRQGGFATAAASDWRLEASKVGAFLRSLDMDEETP